MKHGITFLALATALAIAPAAKADWLQFTGDDNTTALISYTGTTALDGGIQLTSATLTLTCGSLASSDCFAGSFNLSSAGSYGADNEIYFSESPILSGGGLLFAYDSYEINLYYDTFGDNGYSLFETNDEVAYASINGSVATPEPSSWAMLVGGLFALVALFCRKSSLSTTF